MNRPNLPATGSKLHALVALAALAVTVLVAAAAASPAAAEAPRNSGAPTIDGNAVVGGTLMGGNGSWIYLDGTSCTDCTYEFQWRRCDTSGGECADIPGGSGQYYTVRPDDAGSRIRVTVTATKYDCNALRTECRYVSKTADSAPTAVVPGTAPSKAPVNKAVPGARGTAREGQTLAATRGEWNGTPTSFSWQWRRCAAAGSPCADIPGATSESYVLGAADAGHRLQVVVTAHTAGGAASATSAPTDVVAAIPPAPTAAPAVSGVAWQGRTLTASTGEWAALDPTTFVVQWQRCYPKYKDACADIAGATGASYVVAKDDIDRTLRVRVVATHAGASAEAVSELTTLVQPSAPTPSRQTIDISKVTDPAKLVVSQIVVPRLVRGSRPFVVRVVVKDTRGFLVKGALVSLSGARGLTAGREVASGAAGAATFTLRPTTRLRPGSVSFVVRARGTGEGAPSAERRGMVKIGASK